MVEPSSIGVRSQDQSYTVRDLMKKLIDCEDPEQTVLFRFRNCDPVPVTDVQFEESQVVLDGGI